MTNKPTSKTTRTIALPPNFDMAKFKADVAADDAKRKPNQQELATFYASHPDITSTFALHQHSLESVITRIAEQDPRMLDQGRKLLKKMLQDCANRPARKTRARSTAGAKAVAVAPEVRPIVATVRANTLGGMPSLLDGDLGAEQYGG